MKNLVIIPVRSGSQRIRHKNIKLVAGEPLFSFPIKCAKQVAGVDKIVVATDDENYAEIAKSYGAEVIMRPASISGHDSKSEETLLYVIDKLEENNEKFDNVIMMQATSPFTEPEYISKALNLMEEKKYNSIVTYTQFKGFLLEEDDLLLERPMTQKKIPKKIETGCFWVTNISELKKTKNRICEPYGLVAVSHIASLEIDTPEDLYLVDIIMSRKKNIAEDRYFKKRSVKISDEKDYFDNKEDPDGNVRDVQSEKSKKIALHKKEIDYINNLYTKGEKRNFLDLGCGLGFISSAIDSEKFVKYGLEVSALGIESTREFVDHIHNGELKQKTYPEEFFDVIFCNHVIEHVKDPINFIEIINKILKTHGSLIIGTPNFDSGAARRFKDNFRLLHDKTHISLFSDFSLKRMLEDLGFIVDYIDYPFFETEYFTEENLLRLFDTSKISPPFYGNYMTLYCRKK